MFVLVLHEFCHFPERFCHILRLSLGAEVVRFPIAQDLIRNIRFARRVMWCLLLDACRFHDHVSFQPMLMNLDVLLCVVLCCRDMCLSGLSVHVSSVLCFMD